MGAHLRLAEAPRSSDEVARSELAANSFREAS
jgi:hypothetical protein